MYNLLYKRAQLCCGDQTIPVSVKQLESLLQAMKNVEGESAFESEMWK